MCNNNSRKSSSALTVRHNMPRSLLYLILYAEMFQCILWVMTNDSMNIFLRETKRNERRRITHFCFQAVPSFCVTVWSYCRRQYHCRRHVHMAFHEFREIGIQRSIAAGIRLTPDPMDNIIQTYIIVSYTKGFISMRFRRLNKTFK